MKIFTIIVCTIYICLTLVVGFNGVIKGMYDIAGGECSEGMLHYECELKKELNEPKTTP